MEKRHFEHTLRVDRPSQSLCCAIPSSLPATQGQRLAIDPSEINTRVLRQVPDHLYRRLKAIANSNRRSMNQALVAGLPDRPAPLRPDLETSRHWLQRQIWNLPLQGRRSAEAILGFGDDGLCH